MKTQTKVLFVLVSLIMFAGIARAQTVEQVANELDSVEVTVDQVNAKAEDAKGKANGLELRVTNLEALPAVDPTLDGRVTSNEAAVVNHGGRIAALESNPGGVDQASHDALSSRVTALESAVPETPLGWSLYDQSGARLGHWTQREQVGRLLVNVGAYSIWAQLDRDRVSYLGIVRPVEIRYKNMISGYCVDPFVVADDYLPLVQNSAFYYGGQVHGWLDQQKRPSPTDGHLFVVDTVTPEVFTGAFYILNVKQACVTGSQMPQSNVHVLRDQGVPPTFSPPFDLVQE